MIQGQNKDARVGYSKRAFHQIDVFARTGQPRHVYGEVRIRHHPCERIHHQIRVTPAREVKREMIPRIVQRTEERYALDVVQMKMTEKDVGADRLVAEFLL